MNPIAWTIAGSDPSGCAGIQADLKTFQNLGVHGCSIVTAVTAQNTYALSYLEYHSNESIGAQIDILCHDLAPKAIKIGLFNQCAVYNFLRNYKGLVVLDPLINATSGKKLYTSDFDTHLLILKKIFPYVDILTPNLLEAEKIAGYDIQSNQDIQKAAHDILLMGVKSVLIKGGHWHDEQFSQDYWTDGKEAFWLANKRINKKNLRGIGCTLSSAITACLALGYPIKEAIVIAKMYVNRGIRLTNSTWLSHMGWPEDKNDFPSVTSTPMQTMPDQFPDCGAQPLGLYPVVDHIKWLTELLSLGVTAIQLRLKNKSHTALEDEIQKSIAIAKFYNARLFINDYWELAIKYDAYGVHLGQEDLHEADIKKIHAAGLRLGISTHSYFEAGFAHALAPSYIAFGPIFPTQSKNMSFAPQGLERLTHWQRISNYPIVAIGGINHENLAAVINTNVNGIAMISAIINAENPQMTTKRMLQQIGDSHASRSG